MKAVKMNAAVLGGIIVITGGGLGYFLRYAMDGHESKGDAKWEEVTGRKLRPSRRGSGQFHQLEHELKSLEGSTHWMRLVSGMEVASLDDLAEFAIIAKDHEMVLRLITEHWLEQDPGHLFKTISEKSKLSEAELRGFPYRELSRALFTFWPQADMEATIAALSVSGKIREQERYKIQVYAKLIDLNPERGISLSKQWKIQGWAVNREGFKKWIKKDPRTAAEAIFDNAMAGGAKAYTKDLAEIWGKSDPEGALNFAFTKQGHLSHALQEVAMKNWAQDDFKAASKWLKSQDDSALHARLTPQLIEVWGKDDPEAALAWCQDHLTGSLLVSAVGKLAAGAAIRDVESAAAMVAGLKKSPARTQAGIEVASAWFPERSYPPKRDVPAEGLDWLRSLNDLELQGKIVHEIYHPWLYKDRDSLLSFLSEPHAARVPDSVFKEVARRLASRDPEAAFQWAETLPEKHSETVVVQAFTSWSDDQPESAGRWLQDIPELDPRRPGFVKGFMEGGIWKDSEKVLLQRMETLKPGDADVVRALAVCRTSNKVPDLNFSKLGFPNHLTGAVFLRLAAS